MKLQFRLGITLSLTKYRITKKKKNKTKAPTPVANNVDAYRRKPLLLTIVQNTALFVSLHSPLTMANKLKVEELRTELAKRGLSTTGTKPTLVWKLTPFSLFFILYCLVLLLVDSTFVFIIGSKTRIGNSQREQAITTRWELCVSGKEERKGLGRRRWRKVKWVCQN